MTPGDGGPVLEARALSSGYGSVPVVRDLDLEVRRGEIVALLGANGAGKTTTLLTLAGDLPSSAGAVLWKGEVTSAPLHQRARNGTGLVTEERSVFGTLSTRDNLRLGQGGVDRALELVPELEPLLDRRAGLLSGGEQQMLTLARTLAAGPACLLADEVSLGLAPLIVDRLFRAIRAAADTGTGVLLVEQQLHRALDVADRAYVMARGRIALSGTVSEVRGRLSEVEDLYVAAGTNGKSDRGGEA